MARSAWPRSRLNATPSVGTLTGPFKVPDAITDTGPPLHLHEIDRLSALRSFEQLRMPPLVVKELSGFGLVPARLFPETDPRIVVTPPENNSWQELLQDGGPRIQPADAQVLVLARQVRFQLPVLTDDLSLRRRVEGEGGTAVGSLGILLRSFRDQALSREELEDAVERLMTGSTLHLSAAFRAYVRGLLRDL